MLRKVKDPNHPQWGRLYESGERSQSIKYLDSFIESEAVKHGGSWSPLLYAIARVLDRLEMLEEKNQQIDKFLNSIGRE